MADVMRLLSIAIDEAVGRWLHPVKHADAVLQMRPVWARAGVVKALTGVGRDYLGKLAERGLVRAKLCGDRVVLYYLEDVLSAIESLPNRFDTTNNKEWENEKRNRIPSGADDGAGRE